jgi:hypothetical protein
MRWLVVAMVALGGCAGELDVAAFAECEPGGVEALIALRCVDGCHDAERPPAGLDLVSPGLGGRLLGVASASDACAGRPLIEADGSGGLLVDKVAGDPSCGAAMPLGRRKLSAVEVECVRRWAEAMAGEGGAP